ncbi:hypothetical protein FA13DRAFT_1795433 [Coprinellus micaceus]|uniref:Uncharacterized protein n=1 Tax=Coprinellus micaceus TaxID=71717 RepID=A0A4Y7SY27_COPMI|nr:hypothetical protein FA13DRAFT_1795433 [Coprinellus micaceus]
MASERKILKKASARQANSNEGTAPVTAPDECRGVAAATSTTRVQGDRSPTTVFPQGCTVLQGVLVGDSDEDQSKTKQECASVQLPSQEIPKDVNGAKDIPEVPRMYLSKVRGVDIIGRFGIEVRPLGEVDPEDFECIVSSVIGTIRRTVPEREREQYHYDLLKTLEKDDFDTKYDGAVAKFSLRNHLEADLEGFGTKSEAWARKIIDLFIKASHESKGFLEICLARDQGHRKGQADQFPCIIRKGDRHLQLTGRVDYMLTHFLKADKGLSSTTLSRSSSLDRVVPLMRPYTNILLIEAKRMDPKENIVSRNLPQVLAQAHLSMSKTGYVLRLRCRGRYSNVSIILLIGAKKCLGF